MSELSVTLFALIWIPPSHQLSILWVREETPQAIGNWEVPHNHAGILLCFSEMPRVASSLSMEAALLFFAMFPFPLFTPVGPWLSSPQYPALFLYRLAEHIRHLFRSLKVSPRYNIQWFGHAWILSTPMVNGLTSFFARYVFAGTLFGFGSKQPKIRSRSLKLPSDQPCLAFRINSSITKQSTVQCFGYPFDRSYIYFSLLIF